MQTLAECQTHATPQGRVWTARDQGRVHPQQLVARVQGSIPQESLLVLEKRPEALFNDPLEEGFFGGEVKIETALGNPRPPGDVFHAGRGEALAAELFQRRFQDGGPPRGAFFPTAFGRSGNRNPRVFGVVHILFLLERLAFERLRFFKGTRLLQCAVPRAA